MKIKTLVASWLDAGIVLAAATGVAKLSAAVKSKRTVFMRRSRITNQVFAESDAQQNVKGLGPVYVELSDKRFVMPPGAMLGTIYEARDAWYSVSVQYGNGSEDDDDADGPVAIFTEIIGFPKTTDLPSGFVAGSVRLQSTYFTYSVVSDPDTIGLGLVYEEQEDPLSRRPTRIELLRVQLNDSFKPVMQVLDSLTAVDAIAPTAYMTEHIIAENTTAGGAPVLLGGSSHSTSFRSRTSYVVMARVSANELGSSSVVVLSMRARNGVWVVTRTPPLLVLTPVSGPVEASGVLLRVCLSQNVFVLDVRHIQAFVGSCIETRVVTIAEYRVSASSWEQYTALYDRLMAEPLDGTARGAVLRNPSVMLTTVQVRMREISRAERLFTIVESKDQNYALTVMLRYDDLHHVEVLGRIAGTNTVIIESSATGARVKIEESAYYSVDSYLAPLHYILFHMDMSNDGRSVFYVFREGFDSASTTSRYVYSCVTGVWGKATVAQHVGDDAASHHVVGSLDGKDLVFTAQYQGVHRGLGALAYTTGSPSPVFDLTSYGEDRMYDLLLGVGGDSRTIVKVRHTYNSSFIVHRMELVVGSCCLGSWEERAYELPVNIASQQAAIISKDSRTVVIRIGDYKQIISCCRGQWEVVELNTPVEIANYTTMISADGRTIVVNNGLDMDNDNPSASLNTITIVSCVSGSWVSSGTISTPTIKALSALGAPTGVPYFEHNAYISPDGLDYVAFVRVADAYFYAKYTNGYLLHLDLTRYKNGVLDIDSFGEVLMEWGPESQHEIAYPSIVDDSKGIEVRAHMIATNDASKYIVITSSSAQLLVEGFIAPAKTGIPPRNKPIPIQYLAGPGYEDVELAVPYTGTHRSDAYRFTHLDPGDITASVNTLRDPNSKIRKFTIYDKDTGAAARAAHNIRPDASAAVFKKGQPSIMLGNKLDQNSGAILNRKQTFGGVSYIDYKYPT